MFQSSVLQECGEEMGGLAQCFRSVERRWGARIRELLEENWQKVTLRRKEPFILEAWRHSIGRAFWSQNV